MRKLLAQIALLMACLLASSVPSPAQYPLSRDVTVTCPSLDTAEPHSGFAISIADVRFSGALQLPVSEQEEIAASVKEIRGRSLDAVRKEALDSPGGQRVTLSAYVDEGIQYRLGYITFRNNKAIKSEPLRKLVPMKDGDIFSREKMAEGIENLRLAYGEVGYISYTGVPDTKFEDETKIINIEFDVDEGKQFFVSSINILGLNEHSRKEMLKEYPIGTVYNQRLFGLFLERQFDLLKMHHEDPRLVRRHLDERNGTLAITVYACPCPVCPAATAF